MGYDKVARTEFLDVLLEESDKPFQEVYKAWALILRHAVTHGKLAVQGCNGPAHLENKYYWDRPKLHARKKEEWSEWRDKRESQIEKRLFELAEGIGVTLELGGDPRGYTVKLMTPNTKRCNTWGGEASGWGLPQ
jgi:hypothetical protein